MEIWSLLCSSRYFVCFILPLNPTQGSQLLTILQRLYRPSCWCLYGLRTQRHQVAAITWSPHLYGRSGAPTNLRSLLHLPRLPIPTRNDARSSQSRTATRPPTPLHPIRGSDAHHHTYHFPPHRIFSRH